MTSHTTPWVRHDVQYMPGGEEHRLDLYRPDGDLGTLRPTLVFLHGGRVLCDDKRSERSVSICRDLAREGYLVAAVNTSRTGGRAADPRWPEWPRSLLDARAALEYLGADYDRLGADPRRVAAVGVSSGATLALLLAFADEEDIRAIVCEGGEFPEPSLLPRLRGVVNLYGVADFRLHVPEALVPSSAERAALASPAAYVHDERWLPSVLSIHGTDDRSVPYAQAQMLDDVLVASGNDHLLCPVTGAGHGFTLRVGDRDLRPVVSAFLDKIFP